MVRLPDQSISNQQRQSQGLRDLHGAESKLSNANIVINSKMGIQKKNEMFSMFFAEAKREFKSDEEISYFSYFASLVCGCCVKKQTRLKYDFEVQRIKKLLDIRYFNHFLTEAYVSQFKSMYENEEEIKVMEQ
eukprot:CAMPEP_0170537054 /NCGR_PEP_ID=MMETSP0209-20121228/102498_1 /TAXON_ID=665100 ORGANISM="Litonotus pictus, Strain P1" /NCGR_SAMPLE_ID=MMETSP0209 /ASSEMBLY_ACC=CAM_ASM_000301 /LENGTH=132 /DNA_ID=CAMNT_0010838503 /DNA_START=1691 /DNA_END=2089 /DNA_ORIENTATION=+